MARTRKAKKTASGRCAGKTKKGPCGAHPVGGGRFCFFHDPELEEERRKARRRGAAVANGYSVTPLALKVPESLCTIRELMELVEVILRGCIDNDVDHKLANAMGGLIRVQAGLLVDYQLEDRIQALEAALEKE